MGWEYGIRRVADNTMHRTGYTRSQVEKFLDEAVWKRAGIDVAVMFEGVRRPLGDWEPIPANEQE